MPYGLHETQDRQGGRLKPDHDQVVLRRVETRDPGWRREFRAHRHCYRGDFRTEDFPDNPDPSKPDPSKPEYLPDPFKPDPSKPESLPDQVEKMEQEHDDE